MQLFQYTRAHDVDAAIQAGKLAATVQQGADVRFIAGGTTLLDLMKLEVERPRMLVDINPLELSDIHSTADGGLSIGAMVRNSDLAHYPLVKKRYQVL